MSADGDHAVGVRHVSAERAAGEMAGTRRIAAHMLLAAGAVTVAIMAAWVSRAVWRPGPLAIPWGLVLSVAGSGAAVWLARAAARSLGFVVAAGWIVGLAVLLAGGPGGDLVVIADKLGYSFMLIATGAVIVAAGWGTADT